MKLQRKNSIMVVMILSLFAALISSPTFANDFESSNEMIEESAPAAPTTYISDEEEEETPTTTNSFEEDTSIINSADSDSDF